MSIDIPEGFDLQDRLNAPSTTDDRDRKRCPECLLSGTSRNSKKWDQSEKDYHCEECGHAYDGDEAVTGLTALEVRERT